MVRFAIFLALMTVFPALAQNNISTTAQSLIGAPKKSISKKGFDCSSLVQHVASLSNIQLPRTAKEQASVGMPVRHLEEGDLVFFGKGKRITHVGIFVGDGKMVHVSSRKKRVVMVGITDYWLKRLVAIRRITLSENPDAVAPVKKLQESSISHVVLL